MVDREFGEIQTRTEQTGVREEGGFQMVRSVAGELLCPAPVAGPLCNTPRRGWREG